MNVLPNYTKTESGDIGQGVKLIITTGNHWGLSFEYWDTKRECNVEQGEVVLKGDTIFYNTEHSPFLPHHIIEYLRDHLGYEWNTEERLDEGRMFDSIKRDHDEVIADHERRNS